MDLSIRLVLSQYTFPYCGSVSIFEKGSFTDIFRSRNHVQISIQTLPVMEVVSYTFKGIKQSRVIRLLIGSIVCLLQFYCAFDLYSVKKWISDVLKVLVERMSHRWIASIFSAWIWTYLSITFIVRIFAQHIFTFSFMSALAVYSFELIVTYMCKVHFCCS